MRKWILFCMIMWGSLAILTGCAEGPSLQGTQASTGVESQTGSGSLAQEGDEDQARRIPAQIVRVVDGDTVEVSIDGKQEKVRLLLVDTPETVHPNKPVEPFGPEASQFAKDTLTDKEVQLEMDVSERDKYGRLLAYLWVDDQMFNEMLLEKGLARVAYVYPPNVKHVDRFREIQKQAQEKGIGIWSIENYALEDGFNQKAAAKAEQGEADGQGTAGKSPEPSPSAKPPKSSDQTKAEEPVKEEESSSAVAAGEPAAACEEPTIKGNHSFSGDWIYHVPGGQFYEKTKAEEMFCTEEEAVAAGYRKSKR